MPKKPIIIITVLSVIALGLGYLFGLKDKGAPLNGGDNTSAILESEFLGPGLFLFNARSPSTWTNNSAMQYNPEVGSLSYNIPLPKARNPKEVIPSFSNIKSSIGSHPIHNSGYSAKAYWPQGAISLDPTIITFDVSGSPPLTLRWGICEGNYLRDRLPFDYSLRGPNGQVINAGGNWLRGAEVASVNTVGTYTLTITYNPNDLPFDQLPFDPYHLDGQQIGKQRGATMGFIIESNLGKVVMTIGYGVQTVKPEPEK